MRTNIDIDDALMAEAQKLTGLKTKKDTVEEALIRLIRLERQRVVAGAFGKYRWTGDLDEMRKSRNFK